MRALAIILVLGACARREQAAAPDAAPAAAASAPAADAGAVLVPLRPRPGGPSPQVCLAAAAHLATLISDSAVGATNEERAYVESLLAGRREATVRVCLEVAVPKEVDCMLRAKDFTSLAACERFRREVPEDLIARSEPTLADCERFYDRLRQFKIAEGAGPEDVDKTRDQVIRSCQERAKVGTIACFLAAPTYEQARRCP